MVSPVKRNAFKVIETTFNKVVDSDLIESITIPGVEIQTAEHTEANWAVETPSRMKADDVVIKLAEDTDVRNTFFKDKQPYNEDGSFRPESDYRFDMIIQQLATDRKTAIREWECSGCMIKKSAHEEASPNATENAARTITLSVKRVEERTL